MASESFGLGQLNRVQPIFCDFITMLDVDVRRLHSFSAEEEKSESKQFQDGACAKTSLFGHFSPRLIFREARATENTEAIA
jgi:hypothetical protein